MYWAAASRAHGAGTISDALVARPERKRLVHAGVGRVTGAEVVAVDDQQPIFGTEAEPFCEQCHPREGSG